MKLALPEDPTRRAFVVAVLCSVLLHVLLLGALLLVDMRGLAVQARRGEPLLVDITPARPEDRAPLGNPARPPGAPEPETPSRAPEPPAPAPKVAPAPPPPPAPPKVAPAPRPKSPRPAPEPPSRVAVAPPPPPAPAPKAPPPPAPAPPVAREPEATREPERAPAPEPPPAPPAPSPAAAAPPVETARPQPAPTGPAPSASPGPQTALARPPAPAPPSIFRNPGGGGGLHGGRGGSAGEPIPLDTPDPNYREYMEKVKRRIYEKWGYPYEAQTRGLQGRLVIEFHIAKDGHLQFIELRQTSGEEILDSFAMTAVKLAQIYPPLPDAMKREVLPVVAVFVYTLRGPLSVLQSLQ